MNPRQIQGAIDKALIVVSDKDKAWAFKTNHSKAYDALVNYMTELMKIQIAQATKVEITQETKGRK